MASTCLAVYPLPAIHFTHDAASAIIRDGEVLFAFEEEKIARRHYAMAMPAELSPIAGLRQIGLSIGDIDMLVLPSMMNCAERGDYHDKVGFIRETLMMGSHVPVRCTPHHLSHSALAVLTSPFESCIFLTMDAGGDGVRGQWGVFRDGQFNVVEQLLWSPAVFYSYLLNLAGFTMFEEGKLMGLAAHGQVNERLLQWFRVNFGIKPGGAELAFSDELTFAIDGELLPGKFDPDNPRRSKFVRKAVRFECPADRAWISGILSFDIAATGQKHFEDLVTTAIENLVERTGLTSIALSGGAFQNVVINGKLRARPDLKVHVPLAPHDSGLAVGAGLLTSFELTGKRPAYPLSPYLGPSYSEAEIETALNAYNMTYTRPADIHAVVVGHLMAGDIVGWFQGRAEFGPRALGARSVIADPRQPKAKARLNQSLKMRDWFMPYAPSILEERAGEFLLGPLPSPYMNTTFTMRQVMSHLVPDASHIDATCRAHLVNRQLNPSFHKLISMFAAATGIPMVLNTSFNRHGIPIVATPMQAVDHLLQGNIDVLSIGPFIATCKRTTEVRTVYLDQTHLNHQIITTILNQINSGRHDAARTLAVRLPADIRIVENGLSYNGKWHWTVGDPIPTVAEWNAIENRSPV